MPTLSVLKRSILKNIERSKHDIRTSIGELRAVGFILDSHWELSPHVKKYALECAGKVPQNLEADIESIFRRRQTLTLQDFGQNFLNLSRDKRTGIGRHLDWKAIDKVCDEEGISLASVVCLAAAWTLEQSLGSRIIVKEAYTLTYRN